MHNRKYDTHNEVLFHYNKKWVKVIYKVDCLISFFHISKLKCHVGQFLQLQILTSGFIYGQTPGKLTRWLWKQFALLVWASRVLNIFWVICCKGICSQVLIDTLERYSIIIPSTPWLTLDTPLTSLSTVGQESTNFWSIHMNWSTLSQLSTNCWSSVDRVLTKCWSGCWLSIYWSRCWWRVSINTQPQMPFSAHDPVFL